MRKYIAILFVLVCLVACKRPEEPTLKPNVGTSMLIAPPFVEPSLDWSLTYKGLINIMEQKGFCSTRITSDRLYYDYFTRYELLESAMLSLDTAQNYIGAEITVKASTVSQTDIGKYLSQQYTETGSTSYPIRETYYRSKTKTDSVLVCYRVENGYPVITYTKGMN